MRIERLLKTIEEILPRETAIEGDRIGLQIQSGRNEIQNLLFTIEVDDKVIEEAVKLKCDCIITFHPLIFFPLTSIQDTDRVGKLTTKLISNSISLISIHTNFDSYSKGTSRIFANLLGLETKRFLIPDKSVSGRGMGVIACPKNSLKLDDLISRLHSICNAPIRYTIGKKSDKIESVAIVGGSGTAFFEDAISAGVDAFITADISYHTFHRAKGRLTLIDAGHYEMEQFVPLGLMNLLKENLKDSEINSYKLSKQLTNPVLYYPYTDKYSTKQKDYLLNR
ncbi:MAG: Nif3-like dinuclear metal center hexameric protein [Bacteroidota bacterium]